MGAAPQPIKAAEKGHDAVFGADGALWFLMAAGDRDQLFRMPIGGAPVQVSDFGADISGFKLSPGGDRSCRLGRRPDCPDLACACACPPSQAGSGRTYDKLFVRHWDTWAEQGTKSRLYSFPIADGKLSGGGVRLTGNLEGDTPSKPFGGGEEIAFSPDGQHRLFRAARGGPHRIDVDQPRHLPAPSDGSAAPVNLTDANDGMDNLPAVSPDGRTLAYFAMARPTYEADRQVLMLRDLASGKVRR